MPKQLYTLLPVMHLAPVKDREIKTSKVYRCPVYKILSRQGAVALPSRHLAYLLWRFDCAGVINVWMRVCLYCLAAGTLSTTGHSTNFVMFIELPSDKPTIINDVGLADSDVWIKAGVAAFCALRY
jgi:dynein heavy chain